MLDKISKHSLTINESHVNFKDNKKILEESFGNSINNFRQIFGDSYIKDFETDIKIIEKSYQDFKKYFPIYEDKLKLFNSFLSNFKEKSTMKLKENNLHPLPDNYKEVKEKIREIYKYLITLINSPNEKLNEIVSKIENYWNINKMNSYVEIFNNIYKLRVNLI